MQYSTIINYNNEKKYVIIGVIMKMKKIEIGKENHLHLLVAFDAFNKVVFKYI